MKEQLPAPDFDGSGYERPNRKWICGKAADGKACRLGPDARGQCRVTYECQPALKVQPGETKGHYYCNRTADLGGPCASGPLPDGTCARPIVKCVPVRSLQAKRKILTLCLCVLTTGFLLVALCGPLRWRSISPGALSAPHASATFARLVGGDVNCAVCHSAARGGIFTWAKVALTATPGPFQFHELAARADSSMTRLDQNCLICHAGHSFHEPNVVRQHSCSDCHVEHQGPGAMRPPQDAQCLSCHGNAAVMQASSILGEKLPASAFDFHPDLGRVLFRLPRPKAGYTQVIHSFAADHPEFQIISERLKDPDTLKFNHQLHLTPLKVKWQGRKLECADCHKPDAAGVYHLKITYEENCRKCHAIQFDIRNPGLSIPHGSVELVRAFLRTLPQQYADYAALVNGTLDPKRNEAFAQEQFNQLRKDFASGEELERSVFFNEKREGLGGPALFPGCAYCHEVKPAQSAVAQVIHPVIPDRWLVHGGFNHSKHLQNIQSSAKIDCAACHDAQHSGKTSDILLPSKQTCAQCHSPAGGVASSCSTCHGYHSPRKNSNPAPLGVVKARDSEETLRTAIVSRDK
jgi:hypothetical protein